MSYDYSNHEIMMKVCLHENQMFKGFRHKKKCLYVSLNKLYAENSSQYIELLSQSDNIYILNFIYTFLFLPMAILFICMRFHFRFLLSLA